MRDDGDGDTAAAGKDRVTRGDEEAAGSERVVRGELPDGLDPAAFALLRSLAARERGSASAGSRAAAEEIAGAFRALGLEARVEHERVHGTYWWPLGLASAAAVAAAVAPGRAVNALVAAAATWAIADDLSVPRRALRRVLARRTAANVVAELGAPDARRTLVVHAHHDAAHTGLVFHPATAAAAARHAGRLIERVGATPAPMWNGVAGPALVALGAAAGRNRIRAAGVVTAAGFAAAMADIGLRRPVPAANDNLSGLAALLSAARALADDPPTDTDLRVVFLSTDSEESFLEGMVRFGERHFPGLPRERTHFLCLESVGSPDLFILDGEGFLRLRAYPTQPARALLAEQARRLGVPLRDPFRYRFATDGQVPLRAGYPTATLTSMDTDKAPSNYHWPTDVPENLHAPSIAAAARLAAAYAHALAAPLSANVCSPAGPAGTVRRMPRISYYPVETLEDPELRGYLEHAARYGAPRPESQAIRSHVPAVLRSFSTNWQRVFRTGVTDHALKELCRVYVSKTIDCHY